MKALFNGRKRRVVLLLTLLLAAPLPFLLPGCTDLGEETFGVITPDNFYRTEEEVLAAMVPVYAQLRTALGAYHDLSQVSADESIVPTRGQDWNDGGKWIAMDGHTWDPSLPDLNTAWVNAFTGVARANGLLENLQEIDIPDKARIEAELRVLRAYFYYQLLDLFGRVPIVGDDEFALDPDNLPPNEPRAVLFNWIEQELLESREALPLQWDASNFGRVTQGAADALLASMYLNAEIWTGELTATSLTRGTPRWQDAVDAVDRILNSGVYQLETDWFRNFSPDNENSPEHIFLVQHLPLPNLGETIPYKVLHYNQWISSAGQPWNGFSTLADIYLQFDENDRRREIFLAGQAYSYETGEPVTDRSGNPLIFDDIEDILNSSEGDGIRILKFPPDPASTDQNSGNDYAFFRLAEMYLIKAEALNELRGPNQESIDLINLVRQRVFDAGAPLQLGDFPTKESLRQRILQERLFELTYEAKRRQDLIRIPADDGKPMFLKAWKFKPESEVYRILFPIPQVQVDANDAMTQNPGY